jgi:hypothetical protein
MTRRLLPALMDRRKNRLVLLAHVGASYIGRARPNAAQLALLRHVTGRWVPARRGAWQAGRRGSQRAMARAIASRMVAKLSAK